MSLGFLNFAAVHPILLGAVGLIFLLIALVIVWAIVSIPVYFAAKIIVGSRASIGSAMLATLVGPVVFIIVRELLRFAFALGPAALAPLAGLVAIILAFLAYLAVFKSVFSTGWLGAFAISVLAIVILVIIVVLLGLVVAL